MAVEEVNGGLLFTGEDAVQAFKELQIILAGRNSQEEPKNKKTRNKIAEVAKTKVSSLDWDYAKDKDNFPAGVNKCNKFVYDVLREAGASPGTPNGSQIRRLLGDGYPPTAAQWANPNFNIPNWRVLQPGESPEPGDVVAQKIDYDDATGHVGIVVGPGQTVSQASDPIEIVVQNDWGFRTEGSQGRSNQVVYRRYVGALPQIPKQIKPVYSERQPGTPTKN
jgi:hypothetical protein